MTGADALPPYEKTLILAAHARILNDRPKAIEYYESLAKGGATNDEVTFALAALYKDTGAYDEARKRFAQLLARDPKYIEALLGAGQVESWSGKPADALDYLNRALTVVIQGGNDEAKATVLRLLGGTYAGLNKPREALQHYQESLALERRLGRTSGVAETLNAMAQMKDYAGQPEAALADYREALALRRQIGDKQGIGNVTQRPRGALCRAGAVRRGARAVQGRAADSARGAESFVQSRRLEQRGIHLPVAGPLR